MSKIKISEWLEQYGTHDIVDDEKTRKSFEEMTGRRALWGESYSKKEMEYRAGPSGGIHADDDAQLNAIVYIAEWCAERYAKKSGHRRFAGFGFTVRACIEELKEKGC